MLNIDIQSKILQGTDAKGLVLVANVVFVFAFGSTHFWNSSVKRIFIVILIKEQTDVRSRPQDASLLLDIRMCNSLKDIVNSM